MKRFLLFITLVSLFTGLFAVEPQTYEFAVIDGDTLRMDVYMPKDSVRNRTAVLFAFGGAFTHGKRNDDRYIEYFNFLADNGIVVASTDYRTILAKDKSLLTTPQGIEKAFTGAINAAVSDYYTATYYLIQNSRRFGIDTDKIIASGSSAGAITALQAEYGLRNGMAGDMFPSDFNYAGVVSFAGAILSVGPLTWTAAPCPMMLYHGNADRNVPYSQLSAGPIALNGSAIIANSLADDIVPCEFYTFAGADHSIAISPMHDNLYEILGFVKRISANSERLSVNAVLSMPGAKETPAPSISIEDIIKSNL